VAAAICEAGATPRLVQLMMARPAQGGPGALHAAMQAAKMLMACCGGAAARVAMLGAGYVPAAARLLQSVPAALAEPYRALVVKTIAQLAELRAEDGSAPCLLPALVAAGGLELRGGEARRAGGAGSLSGQMAQEVLQRARARMRAEPPPGCGTRRAGGEGRAAGGGARAAGAARGGQACGGGGQLQQVCARCSAAPAAGAKFQLCAGCRALRYCGPACQKAHWRQHKAACKAACKQGRGL
jgi:hypothetical protein